MAGGEITLDKIDILRQRAGVSYRQAYELLQETGGDVVAALIKLEEMPRGVSERIQVTGAELVSRVRQLLREGNVNRIIVRKADRVLLDIPVTAGVVGAILMPYLAALGLIAAVAARHTIEVERRTGAHRNGGAAGGNPGNGAQAYAGYTGVAGARAVAAETAEQPAAVNVSGPAAEEAKWKGTLRRRP